MGHEVALRVTPDATVDTTVEASGVTPAQRASHKRNRPLLPPLPQVPGFPSRTADLLSVEEWRELDRELEAFERSGHETFHPAGGSLDYKSFG